MPKITFVQPDGTESALDVDAGTTVMMAALAASVEGILAECGGNAMCATCHVVVVDPTRPGLPPVSDDEDEMLDCTASPRKEGSRLSCQLPVTEELDGLVVRLPEEQM
ncbi:2Fe-2S iron-sulfur cluster-binding protein [Cryptosporangium phraense]|uniref:2Fe-2S iron-sulfur cluster-binding protein n=1 Tax=Cryptosporangium phraense TaxID=2593070 RepID=UPI00197AF4B8|nr:2Fe-2S iron-sulfur cluster-binding protein [Cryptosporangium phraense]